MATKTCPDLPGTSGWYVLRRATTKQHVTGLPCICQVWRQQQQHRQEHDHQLHRSRHRIITAITSTTNTTPVLKEGTDFSSTAGDDIDDNNRNNNNNRSKQ